MFLKVEIDGVQKVFSFEGKSSITVGRDPDSDLQLLAEGVSRKHLLVCEVNGDVFIEDLGSTNGTFLNGEKIQKGELVRFNSFFPIQLGESAQLFLMDETSGKAFKKGSRVAPKAQLGKGEKTVLERIYIPKNKVPPSSSDVTRVFKRQKIALKSTVTTPRRRFPASTLWILAIGLLSIIGHWATMEKEPVDVIAPVNKTKRNVAKVVAEAALGFSAQDAAGIIALDKCFGDLEATLCKPLLVYRKKNYHEGFLALGERLFLVLDITAVSQGYSDAGYSEEEEREALNYLLNESKGAKSSQEILEQGLRSEAAIDGALAQQAAAITDMALIGVGDLVLTNLGEREFYVVLTEGRSLKYAGHVKVERKFLEALVADKSVGKSIKYFWRSGIQAPLRQWFSKNELKF